MAKKIIISNVGENDLVFPSGDLVETKKSAAITTDDLEHPVVKAWLTEGKIKKGEIVAEEPAAPSTDADAVKKTAEDEKAKADAAKAKADDDAAKADAAGKGK